MTSTVVILGSPRNGTSDSVAMEIANASKSKGNEIKTFKLNQFSKAKGCQSCYRCKEAGECVLKDDISTVLDAVRKADGVILATPIYFGHTTSQFRMFEDRCFGFLKKDFSPNIGVGKKVAIVCTCGSGLNDAKRSADELENEWTNFFKANVIGKIVADKMLAPDAALNNAEIMSKAKSIGEKF
ncbi:MAG: flavodoxin family protein [archaeon]|nr:flavodoxin family protein [archaeon]